MKSLLLFVSLIFIFTVSAQRPGGGGKGRDGFMKPGSISGQVVDTLSNESMSYVTVSLYKVTKMDTSLVTGKITNDQGEFEFTGLTHPRYLMKFKFIGYNEVEKSIRLKPDNSQMDIGKVFLKPETMKDFDVTVDRPIVRYEIDKKVVNVEDMNTVAAATAIEVLENIPSVTVDMDGNVQLRGSSGFTLLIDGVPTGMNASDALATIPASNIKDIEIITNPSAKYDAEGSGGIINVILKKGKLEGVSTLINVNAGTFNNYSGDALVSINRNKWKFNVGGNFRHANRYRNVYQQRITYSDSATDEVIGDGEHRFWRTNGEINTAIEYKPNRKNVFNIGINGNQRQYNAAANYFFDEYNNDSLIVSYENRERTLRNFYGLTISPGYRHFFNGNKKHVLHISGMTNYFDGVEDALAEFYDAENNIQGGNANEEVGPSRLARFNVDYEKELKNEMNLSLGSRVDLGLNNDQQKAYEYNTVSAEYDFLPLFSSDVEYVQNIYAAYAILGGKHKKKLGYQFGLRSEYTDRDVQITNNPNTTVIQRLDWFPSAHFSYSLDKKNQFKANFARRIQRPRSWQLEPFITWEDPYTVRQGNPNLLPEYIQSYELGYIRNIEKGSLSAELYYRRTQNLRQRIQTVYLPNVILKQLVNAGVSDAVGLESSFSKRITRNWKFDLGANAFYFKIEGDLEGRSLNQESFVYNFRLNNSFNILKDWKLQLVGMYRSQEITVQGINADFFSADVSLKRDFLDKKLSGSVQFRNFLNTAIRESIVDTEDLYTRRVNTPYYPEINVSLSIRLNNFKNQDKIDVEAGDEF